MTSDDVLGLLLGETNLCFSKLDGTNMERLERGAELNVVSDIEQEGQKYVHLHTIIYIVYPFLSPSLLLFQSLMSNLCSVKSISSWKV